MTNDEKKALKELIQAETGPLCKLIEANHAEMTVGFDDMRRHFKVVTEDLRGGIKLLAEGHMALDEKITGVDRRVTSLDGKLDTLDLKATAIQGDVRSLHAGQRAIVDAVRDVNERLETLESDRRA